MDKLVKILEKIGFNKKEAKVYLACLKLGLGPASKIAGEANINRVTAYEMLRKMADKGLASITEKRGVKYFSVLSADRLFQHIKDNVQDFQNNLKEFLFLEKPKKQPKISFYEGEAGLQHVYEDFMSYKNIEVMSITSCQGLYEAISKKQLHSYYKNRKIRNIIVKSLCPDTPESMAEQMYDKKANRKIKLFSHQRYNIPNEVVIYADKVALMSLTDKIAVIIENKEIAGSMRAVWQMAWDRFK